jgi:hypothetical protein
MQTRSKTRAIQLLAEAEIEANENLGYEHVVIPVPVVAPVVVPVPVVVPTSIRTLPKTITEPRYLRKRKGQQYAVDIEFDEASREWRANKRAIGNGEFKYITPFLSLRVNAHKVGSYE